MRKKRTVLADPEVEGTFHIYSRCVQQKSLLGDGATSRGTTTRRRQIVLKRIKALAAAFAIDVIRISLMLNHYHFTLRNRPDLVQMMSDEEVARRYLAIYPGYCQATADARNKSPTPPSEEVVQKLTQDKVRIAKYRKVLSSISRFMQAFNFYVSRYFNIVDGTVGAFWESRYKIKQLLDDLALLLCAFYIDSNPIRANASLTPEKSEYTSAYYQIRAASILAKMPHIPPEKLPNAFLSPVTISKNAADKLKRLLPTRASEFGFTDMSSEEYLIALDLVARIISKKHVGAIPADLPPIFERLKLNWESVAHLVEAYDELFCTFVGSKKSLEDKASAMHCGPLKCPAATQGLIP